MTGKQRGQSGLKIFLFLPAHVGQGLQVGGLRLINPEPSSQVLLVPVTGWGIPQEGHYHIMWLCKGHLLQGIIQPVLDRYIRDE